MALEAEARLVALLAADDEAGENSAGLTQKRTRMAFFLDAIAAQRQQLLSPDMRHRKQLAHAVQLIYSGERRAGLVCDGLVGVEAAFLRRVLHHLANTDSRGLADSLRENQTLQGQVLEEPPAHRFFSKSFGTFCRVAQLCDSQCARKHDSQRLFPGDIDKERAAVLQEIAPSWFKYNYYISEAIQLLWSGERELDALCCSLNPTDYGSRYCIAQILQLCRDFGVADAGAPALDPIPPAGSQDTRDVAGGSRLEQRAGSSGTSGDRSGEDRRNAIAVPEISAGCLQLEDRPLAGGSFKEVFRAFLSSPVCDVGPAGLRVAVIRLRAGPGSLVPELDVFTKLGRHPNLTRLLAVTRLGSEVVSLVTEFAELGSLDHVLMSLEDADQSASVAVLLAAGLQVIDGMLQLQEHGVIHRDMAIRNVLAFSFDHNDYSKVVVKLTDYGLSTSGTYAGKSTSRLGDGLPFRWMSPEAIQRRKWSGDAHLI